MAYKSKRKRIEIGRLYLSEPGEKYPYWQICWYDADSKQTRRVPARPEHDSRGKIEGVTEEDRSAAKFALLRFAEENPELAYPKTESVTALAHVPAAPQDGEVTAQNDLSVHQCLLHYQAARAKNLSAKPAKKKRNANKPKTLMKVVARVWGDPTCRQLTPAMQGKLVDHMRKKGCSDGTVLDALKMVWTSMYHMRDRGLLVPASIPVRLSGRKWDPPARFGQRKTKLTDAQIVDVFIAAANPSSPEYVWRWLIVQVGAICRPSAPLELRRSNFDAQVGNLTLLETDAVQEENKRKATIRCCPTLRGWLEHWAQEEPAFGPYRKTEGVPFGYDPHLILDEEGKPITDLSFHKPLVNSAGVILPKGTDAYVWRHTLITWLARHGVSVDQRKFMAGHKIADGAHGDYIHFEPDYLNEAVTAIENLFAMIASKLPPGGRSLLPPSLRSTQSDRTQTGWAVFGLEDAQPMRLTEAMDEQPLPLDTPQSFIRMLRRGSYVVENRGYSVAEFSEILNGIKRTSIALEISPGDQ